MTALIILQLVFLFPFTIHFAFLIANSVTGKNYRYNKISFYIGILLLIVTLFALLVPSSGILSFVVFVDYFYFLYLVFFRNIKEKVIKNPLMVVSKFLLFLTPLVILMIMNVYLIQQLTYSNLEELNNINPAKSNITNLLPVANSSYSVVPLATLLMLSSAILQLTSLSINILLDKIAMNKNANK